MELVEGKTLRELLVSSMLPVRKAIEIAVQVAEGLAKAHEAGITHRDLKPENLMVSEDGFVKILDFGLAKLASPEGLPSDLCSTSLTPSGLVLGTVGYMSPEQANGQRLDFRSDQFSFGLVLYEIVTGKRAFRRSTAAETLVAILREQPEPMGSLESEAPPPLCWVVERCLAKEPAKRYFSTGDLARDLAAIRDRLFDLQPRHPGHLSEQSADRGERIRRTRQGADRCQETVAATRCTPGNRDRTRRNRQIASRAGGGTGGGEALPVRGLFCATRGG